MIDTSSFHVLFGDTFSYRHAQLRIRAGSTGRMVQQTHAHSAAELARYVMTRKWNVVMVAAYFEKRDAPEELIKFFCSIPEEKRPSLVIFHGTTDDSNFVRQLRSVGYICTHIPWDFTDPSKHERQDPKEYYPVTEITQLLLPATVAEAN